MANPPIPPLFCSTPPPIEETAASSQNDEDFCDYSNDNISDYIENDVNDEFNDFSISVPVYFEGNNNIKTVLPDLFANSTSRSIPPNDINCDTTLLTHSENVGADNNEQQNSTANLLSSETKSLNKVDNIKLNDDGHVDDRNEKNFNNFQFGGINEVNKDDSGRSSQSERLFQDVNEIVENPKITEPLNDVVVLEDVPDDDSDDERLSRRNRNNFLHCTEDSEDFFALQPVDVKNHIDNVIDEINTIDLELKTESINTFETVANDELTPYKKVPCRKEIHEIENHDPENESSTIVNQSNADNDKSDDEFANFQDFCTSDNTESGWKASFESPTVGFTKSNNEKPESYDNDSIELGNELDNTYENDDDFGEFSEAPTPLMPIQIQFSNTSTTQSAPTTPSVPQYIETHLKSMLDVMFPKITPSISSNNVDTLEQYQSTNNFLKLAFVESAKALDYQWINSNMRHSLIKSLGIDSRNIFLTEKWNSSMPRFAANLSFDPLQPLKPTSVPLQPEKLSSSNQKTAVPVADVDWQSSGLVNPLDASHVHTLLLDVDQLVVVANLDIINLDSYSSSNCSQSSPSRGLMAKMAQKTTNQTITATKMQQNAIYATADDYDNDGYINKNGLNNYNNAFHGDNLQTNTSTTFFSTFATTTADFKSNDFGTNNNNNTTTPVTCVTGNIIDFNDTDNITLLSSITYNHTNNDMFVNNCNSTHSHYHNNNDNNDKNNNKHINTFINNNFNNNNANNTTSSPLLTSYNALNDTDTLWFNAISTTITTNITTATTAITASDSNLLLSPSPTSSVTFNINHLQFDNLHDSLMMTPSMQSNSITPQIITTTSSLNITTTTPTTNKINDFTNINAHHSQQQMKMSSTKTTTSTTKTTPTITTLTSSKSMHFKTVYRNSRSKAEMATQSADAYNTESCASSVLVDNEADSSEHTCNDNDDTNNASSTNATTETPTIAATTTSAALSSTATRSGHIDARSTNNNKNEDKSDVVDDFVSENNDVGHFDCSNGEIQSESIKELETADDKAYEEGINSPAFEEQEISSTSTQETETKNPSDMHYESVSISRSTFAGPLKETHIFTPSIPDQLDEEMRALPATSIAFPITTTNAATPGTTQKVFPIDFDYEKAAAGIIIDETVVRKEYRDIEYNPGFSLAVETQETTLKTRESINTPPSLNLPSDEFDDEFTDFQSVPPPPQQQQALAQSPTVMRSKPLGLPSATNAAAPTSSGMILSPAILLPQAISIKSKQPKIEWGDSAANIDPDELARIEELFPQQGKNSSRSDSRKSTPTRQAVSTNSLSISASIASQQQQQQLQKNSVDEDDWSEFVSVPIPATETAASTTPSNALNAVQQQSPYRNQVKRNFSTTNNDDEWSDFVSSAPSVPQNVRASPASFGLPQFNSASWQNANFYNNPLSIYHRNYVNTVPNATPTKLKQQQNNNYSSYNNNQNNNNDNNNIDISNNRKQNHVGSNSNNNNFQQQHKYQQQDQYLSNEPQKSTSATAKQLQQQQQIQIMQDFSTSPAVAIPLSYRSHMTSGQSINYAATTAFQVGSAKVAPTVSLIPDLGFVAPAMPVHTAIINALPKPSATTPPPRRK